jgi:hypothetical protein
MLNASKRLKNEKDFDTWEDLETGGRRYWFEIVGRNGGKARYIKLVDENEVTISFVQEIYNAEGILIEIHEKYPIDKRHQKVHKDDN